jgi:hypothetical protein
MFCGFQVDDELEFCLLLDRKVNGLGAFKHCVHIVCDAPIVALYLLDRGWEPNREGSLTHAQEQQNIRRRIDAVPEKTLLIMGPFRSDYWVS